MSPPTGFKFCIGCKQDFPAEQAVLSSMRCPPCRTIYNKERAIRRAKIRRQLSLEERAELDKREATRANIYARTRWEALVRIGRRYPEEYKELFREAEGSYESKRSRALTILGRKYRAEYRELAYQVSMFHMNYGRFPQKGELDCPSPAVATPPTPPTAGKPAKQHTKPPPVVLKFQTVMWVRNGKKPND